MISYSHYALADLLDAFSSSDPVPGGGSAAALAGALGTALLIMVAGLSKTRTGAPEEAADLSEASARLRPLRDSLASLVDRDAEAYSAVVAAMRLPKGIEAEVSARRLALEAATRLATEVPLDTMRACQQALRGAVVVAQAGNRRATSDVGVAIDLILTGLRGAAMNIDANVEGLSDAVYVKRAVMERKELERDGTSDAGKARKLL